MPTVLQNLCLVFFIESGCQCYVPKMAPRALALIEDGLGEGVMRKKLGVALTLLQLSFYLLSASE